MNKNRHKRPAPDVQDEYVVMFWDTSQGEIGEEIEGTAQRDDQPIPCSYKKGQQIVLAGHSWHVKGWQASLVMYHDEKANVITRVLYQICGLEPLP